jgi:hypothetical protein
MEALTHALSGALLARALRRVRPLDRRAHRRRLDHQRWFAAQPAYDGASTGSTCVWFLDLRFVNPGRDWVPFRFGACRETPHAPWRAYERLDGGGRAPL